MSKSHRHGHAKARHMMKKAAEAGLVHVLWLEGVEHGKRAVHANKNRLQD
jgi:hypothetical protein